MPIAERAPTFTLARAGRAWHFVLAFADDSVMVGVKFPYSVAVAPDGHIFVLSRGNISGDFDNHYEGRKIGKWRPDGSRVGDYARREFTWPAGIAVSADGNVFCSDEHDNFVAAFPPDGPFTPYPDFNPDGEHLFKWGEPGANPGQLDGPSGLAFDQNDDLLAVDSRNGRVQRFTKEGRYLSGWGSTGANEGEMDRPWGVCLDGDGYGYVADWGNHRVQKFSREGEFVMSFGSEPESGGDIEHPSDVAVDSDGDVYVVDWGNRRVQIYEPDGEIIGALYGNAIDPYDHLNEEVFTLTDDTRKADARIDTGPTLGRFDRPIGIAIDSDDRVYVTDSRRGRIQVYQKDREFVDAPADR